MTKHANISFADAIRRELHDSGIKVSTVELGFDREPAQAEEQPSETPSKFNKSILEQWNSTAEAIKELYGNEYLQQLKIERLAMVFKNNLDTALDDLVDAVRGQEPAVRYYPYNSLKARLFSNLAQVLPIELLDKYYYTTEKDSPKPLMEREESLCPQEMETIPKSKDD